MLNSLAEQFNFTSSGFNVVADVSVCCVNGCLIVACAALLFTFCDALRYFPMKVSYVIRP